MLVSSIYVITLKLHILIYAHIPKTCGFLASVGLYVWDCFRFICLELFFYFKTVIKNLTDELTQLLLIYIIVRARLEIHVE